MTVCKYSWLTTTTRWQRAFCLTSSSLVSSTSHRRTRWPWRKRSSHSTPPQRSPASSRRASESSSDGSFQQCVLVSRRATTADSASVESANVTQVYMYTHVRLLNNWQIAHLQQHHRDYYYYNLTTICPGLPRWVSTRRINHSGFCWSRHDGVAVASAKPYASYLHFVPEDNHASTSSVRFLWANRTIGTNSKFNGRND